MANAFCRRDFVKLSGISAVGLGAASILSACGGSGSSSSDTIKVGLMGPYSGDVAQYGLAVRKGAELYVKQLNADGGLDGKKIELDTQDEKGDATEAVNVYNKMVEGGVVGIIGDVTSTPSIAVAQVAAGDNMPLVSAAATAADFVSFGPNAFRACITDPYQGKLMSDFAASQGFKTVATIYNSGGDYEKGVNDAFVARCKEIGLSVATEQGYQSGDVDFKGQLTSIIAVKPDAVLSPNYYQEDGQIVTQARQLGYAGAFLGADGWSNIVGGDQEYASAEDLEGCFYDCSFVIENESEDVQKFVKAFQDEYGEAPTNFCALGYDAAMVLLGGIKTALSKGVDLSSDDGRQAIVDGIAQGSVDGVTGTIKYDGSGDPVKPTLVITFEGGSQKVFDEVGA
ncbi:MULTISPECIES: ABC transporter substrate-binding protein [Atopobiaceae]|uniref:Amino acid/amide ABC transporter substrate-binding protein, HAAT family n=1 Tax=Parafannyhessea umbonata TaxID=604330 RepID=A0A1H6KBB1_9ACTN|nr:MULTISPECIES: ABC transporter substrate-binding protein [Atopobiaceae]SEH68750.1 amino acid/amide ABC transporter substrate-binding protein, HAAT family [Parafannyhessea umbonata]SJZ54093.1 amino acid/amide ABC transporter substrate-binding protein, HAAT family (TC 3.A.1.4.-) [Olsenella sp. KH1P3]